MTFDERVIENRDKYSIFFFNIKALEVEKIKEIFSKFGNVLDVRCTGDERGYRFVEYRTYEEAKKAVDGMEDHPFIKIKISKKNTTRKDQNIRNEENSDEKQDQDASAEKGDIDWGNVVSTKTKNHSFSEEATKVTQRLSVANRLQRISNNKLETNIESNENVKGAILENNEDCQTINKQETKIKSIEKVKGTILENNEDCQTIDKQETKIEPIEKAKEAILQKDEDYQTDKFEVLEAAEVIVANINEQYNEAYFLFLFEKYEPLAVTEFLVTPNSNILYCHIYFKTQEDAIEVERCFDNCVLNGRNLIVLRSSELISSMD